MIRSSYTVSVNDNLIFVTDLDGRVSVTNDAENVVESLHKQYGNLDNYIIIYRDTDGQIDELQVRDNEFYAFGAIGVDNLSEAKEMLSERLKKLREINMV